MRFDHGGQIFVTGSAIDYWNRSGKDVQFQAGYSNNCHRLSNNVSATRTRDALSRPRDEILASFTLPLGNNVRAPNLGTSFSHDSSGNTGNSGGNAGTVNASYRIPVAEFNDTVDAGNGYSQASLGASGVVVVHPGGITFGEPIGDTVVIIEAPGAAGVRVTNGSDVRVNGSGYALVPYLALYALNTLQIDPQDLSLDVQLNATSAQVAPHAGAVVIVTFKTESGRSVFLRIPRRMASPCPSAQKSSMRRTKRWASWVRQTGR